MEVGSKIEAFRLALRRAAARLPSRTWAPDSVILAGDAADLAMLDPTPTSDLLAGEKSICLTLTALVHGNETGGIDVLIAVLEAIAARQIRLLKPVAVALGNPQAAMSGQRFLDKDLNRSFGMSSLGTGLEPLRARELQPILGCSRYLLDFHQTREPSHTAFFIFPWSRKSFDFARSITDGLPVVTHWGASFSKDGMCTDEYVNARGGTGITLELGQCGFDEGQARLGWGTAMRALHATGAVSGAELPSIESHPSFHGTIYTWNATIPYPDGPVVDLRPGLVNFADVERGEVLGQQGNNTVTAPAGGRILFPKYIRPGSLEAKAPRPAELLRIMKPITKEELPG
ncbi:MAG: hypothetical protein RIQ81_1809 [Pseudomonadota bacterium]